MKDIYDTLNVESTKIVICSTMRTICVTKPSKRGQQIYPDIQMYILHIGIDNIALYISTMKTP